MGKHLELRTCTDTTLHEVDIMDAYGNITTLYASRYGQIEMEIVEDDS